MPNTDLDPRIKNLIAPARKILEDRVKSTTSTIEAIDKNPTPSLSGYHRGDIPPEANLLRARRAMALESRQKTELCLARLNKYEYPEKMVRVSKKPDHPSNHFNPCQLCGDQFTWRKIVDAYLAMGKSLTDLPCIDCLKIPVPDRDKMK